MAGRKWKSHFFLTKFRTHSQKIRPKTEELVTHFHSRLKSRRRLIRDNRPRVPSLLHYKFSTKSCLPTNFRCMLHAHVSTEGDFLMKMRRCNIFQADNAISITKETFGLTLKPTDFLRPGLCGQRILLYFIIEIIM